MDGWNVTGLKQIRSNSWSESVDDFRLGNNVVVNTTPNNRPLAGNFNYVSIDSFLVNNITPGFVSEIVTSIFPSMNGLDGFDDLKDRDSR